MLELGKRLKQIREFNNISQEKLADMLGVNKATIANYEAGRRALTIEKLQEILKCLNVSLVEFFEPTAANFSSLNEGKQHNKIPIVAEVSAGFGIEGIESFSEYETPEYITLPKELIKKCDFATFANGDSMLPEIKDNDLILVKLAETLNNGNIGIFNLNGEVFVKKYISNPITKETKLISLNSSYPTFIVRPSDSFKIIGKVVGILDWNL